MAVYQCDKVLGRGQMLNSVHRRARNGLIYTQTKINPNLCLYYHTSNYFGHLNVLTKWTP